MATYHITGWRVNRHPATTKHEAYADVTLYGWVFEGVIFRQMKNYSEQLRVPLLPKDTSDSKGSKEIVRRAMKQSADSWKGNP